jgi:hypothetical protein
MELEEVVEEGPGGWEGGAEVVQEEEEEIHAGGDGEVVHEDTHEVKHEEEEEEEEVIFEEEEIVEEEEVAEEEEKPDASSSSPPLPPSPPRFDLATPSHPPQVLEPEAEPKPKPALGIASLSPFVGGPRSSSGGAAGGGDSFGFTKTPTGDSFYGPRYDHLVYGDVGSRLRKEAEATPSGGGGGGGGDEAVFHFPRHHTPASAATTAAKPAWDASPLPAPVPFQKYGGDEEAELRRRAQEQQEEERVLRERASSSGSGRYRDRVGGGFGLRSSLEDDGDGGGGGDRVRHQTPGGGGGGEGGELRDGGGHKLTPPELRARYGLSPPPGSRSASRSKSCGRGRNDAKEDTAAVAEEDEYDEGFTPPPMRGFVGIGGTPTTTPSKQPQQEEDVEEEHGAATPATPALAWGGEGDAAPAVAPAPTAETAVAAAPAAAAPPPPTPSEAAQAQSTAAAAAIFRRLDKNNDGVVNIRELIIALRKDPELARTLGLSSSVRQEDGTRDALERFFQRLDVDGNSVLSMEEFVRGLFSVSSAAAGAERDDGVGVGTSQNQKALAAAPVPQLPAPVPPQSYVDGRRGAQEGSGGGAAGDRVAGGDGSPPGSASAVYRASKARSATPGVTAPAPAAPATAADRELSAAPGFSRFSADPATPMMLLSGSTSGQHASTPPGHQASTSGFAPARANAAMPPEYYVLTDVIFNLRAEASKVVGLYRLNAVDP